MVSPFVLVFPTFSSLPPSCVPSYPPLLSSSYHASLSFFFLINPPNRNISHFTLSPHRPFLYSLALSSPLPPCLSLFHSVHFILSFYFPCRLVTLPPPSSLPLHLSCLFPASSPLLSSPVPPPSLHRLPLFSLSACPPSLAGPFNSPKCWCRCRSALQTSSTWCYATPTGGGRTCGAGCRS